MPSPVSRCLFAFLAALAVGLDGVTASAATTTDASRLAFFEQRIRPVLVEHCYECHSAGSKKLKGGLHLDSKAGILRGGDTGAAITPGHAERSLLIESVGYGNRDLQMPPKSRLPDAVVAELVQWVNDGAFDPRVDAAETKTSTRTNAGTNHWAFQPIRAVEPPRPSLLSSVGDHPVDRFITAKLAERGLLPGPAADRRTLIRRASYGLTGLPPTPDEIAAFVSDASKDTFERMIGRLLASQRYGERWGRWWLDVARYADSNGQDENKVMANAWRYRDWVIRAFNENKPFDAFITEQLAGDLLPTNGLGEKTVFDRWTATGLLVMGPKMLAEQDKPKLVMDLVDEQIDVVGRAFLGLTVACARCHDHKFDPIPARDYYALAGIFKSTKTMANLGFVSKFNERRITPAAEFALIQAHEKKVAALTNDVFRAVRRANEALLAEWRTNFPSYLAAATTDAAKPDDGRLATNLVAGLRKLLAADAATNDISRTLGRLAGDPVALSGFLARTNASAKPATNDVSTADPEARALAETYRAVFGAAGVFALPKEPRPFYPAATRDAIAALEAARDVVKTNGPAPAAFALAVEEDKPVNLPVHIRGSHLSPANDPVPRGFIEVAGARAAPSPSTNGSGRLELARWLTSADNPLTARVIVNRIWQAHFGEGLVRTPDNFGLRGETPSHPELLDWLAAEFIRGGWDVKRLHRLILTSAAWRQDSAGNPLNRLNREQGHEAARLAGSPFGGETFRQLDRAAVVDPDNRLLWRFPRQRLEAEMVRDALLAVSGRLDTTAGGSLVPWKNDEYAPKDDVSATSVRRSVYLPVVRDRVFDVFTIFDFANPSVGTSKRSPTVVSHQALFFLNSPLVKESARAFSRSLITSAPDDAQRIRLAHERAFGRPPTVEEVKRAEKFIASVPRRDSPDAEVERWAAWCQMLFAANEFVYRE